MEAGFSRQLVLAGVDVTVVVGLVLHGRDVADGGVEAVVVEPPHSVHGGEFDVVDATPGAVVANDFGLEQADDGFGQRVVVRIATAADRGPDAGLGQALGVANRQILGEFNRSLQHPSNRGCNDGDATALGRSDRTWYVAITRASARVASGRAAAGVSPRTS